MDLALNRQALIEDLTRDEGIRRYVYDDANGEPLRPGYTLKGHPTIGIGRALDVHGISTQEAEILLDNDIDAVASALTAKLPWFADLDDCRQRALCNIAFNVGVGGLLAFHEMLSAVQGGNYAAAAQCLMQSKLASEAAPRAQRLHDLLQT